MNLALLPRGSIAVSDAYKQRAAVVALEGAVWVAAIKSYVVDASPGNVASLAALCPSMPPEIRALMPAVVQHVVHDDDAWITYDPELYDFGLVSSARWEDSGHLDLSDPLTVRWLRAFKPTKAFRYLLTLLPMNAKTDSSDRNRDRARAPWEHQRDAVGTAMDLLLNRNGGAAYLMEQRTGKSRCSIEVFARLARMGLVRRVLVVSLSTPCGDYAAQVAEYLDGSVPTALLFGTPKQRLKALHELDGPVVVAVINYESAWRLKRELIAWKPDLVIADEMHKIKTPTSKQSKGIHEIGDAARFRLGMTGTATPNSPLDLHSEYRFVDRSVFGDSYFVTKALYAVEGTVKGRSGIEKTYTDRNGTERKIKVVVGYQRLDEFQEKMHSVAFVRRMDECHDLPPVAHVIVPVRLGEKAMYAYRELERESVVEWENGETSVTNVLTRKLRLQQITSGLVPHDDGSLETVGTEKVDAFLDTASGILEDGQKIAVYARFTHEVEGAVETLRKKGFGVVEISGRIPKDERFDKAITPFQKDPGIRAVVCQIQTGGVGIDFSAANTEIFISKSHNFGDYDQARARIVHGSKKTPLTYYHLVAPGTVDEEIEESRELKCNLSLLLLNRSGNPFKREAAR